MIFEQTPHFYAVLGSFVITSMGVVYKFYRMIKEDIYLDVQRRLAFAKVENTPYDFKIKEIHSIIREMEMTRE